MANQIEKTPILRGEDAKRFRENLRKNFSKKSSIYNEDEKKRMTKNYELMKSISGGTF